MVRTSDILVVGAGIVGCAVAYELARRGATVTIVDERRVGAGATQASGGMLAPYSEAAEGGALLELGARSLGLFDAFVAAVESDSGARIEYARSGTLHVAGIEDSLAAFSATHRELAARGVASELLTGAEARAREPQLAADVFGGLLIHTQGLVSAVDMTRAMATAATRRGATLEQARVLRIARAGAAVVVHTEQGTFEAGTVVLAAGAWSGQIVVEGAADVVPVKPVRGQLLHLGWRGTPIVRTTWDERCYVVPWRDGTVLVGATVEDVGFEERVTVAGVRSLLEAACDLLPHAWTANLVATKVGFRPGSPDPLPMVGWSEAVPGLMYATGHYRNGVLLAPLTAALVADAILNGTADDALELMRPSRFGRI